MSKSRFYLKIGIALLIAFISVRVLSKTIFINNNPEARLENLAQIPNALFELAGGPGRYVAQLLHLPGSSMILAPSDFNATNTVFTPISKGVYAGEDKITKKKYIKFDNDVKLNVTEYEFQGKKIMLYEPIAP